MNCPCCGQVAPRKEAAGIIVSHRTVQHGENTVHVTARQQDIMEVLLRVFPMGLPHETLFLRVYGAHTDTSMKTQEVIICSLNKVLPKIGLRIKNLRGFGYKIEKHVAG